MYNGFTRPWDNVGTSCVKRKLLLGLYYTLALGPEKKSKIDKTEKGRRAGRQ